MASQTLALDAQQNAKLVRWQQLTTQLEALKAEELTLRNEIIDTIVPQDKVEGTATFDIGNGWKLKATRKQNYSVDKSSVDTLRDLLPFNIWDDLIRWKPELSMTAYRKSLPAYTQALPEEHRKTLSDALINAVTIRPATPALELLAPKQKGE